MVLKGAEAPPGTQYQQGLNIPVTGASSRPKEQAGPKVEKPAEDVLACGTGVTVSNTAADTHHMHDAAAPKYRT